MGRRKIEIKAIKDDRNRSVTFLKRKGGLFKKAHELSVLCSVDVAVIIFGNNKKLYEFSSGDIHEIIGRHQYYGGAHEHKGPSDFQGKRDGDGSDEEEVDEAALEEQMHPGQQHHPQQPPPHHLPPHMQQQGYDPMRAQPSASPPVPNGVMGYHPRGHTPQPQLGSRPPSRGAPGMIHRPGSNLGHHPQQGPQVPNGYTQYLQQQGPYQPPPQHPGQGPHHQPPHHQQQPHHQQPQQQPPPQYAYSQAPPHQAPQAPMHPQYAEEQRRLSVPPSGPPSYRPPEHQQQHQQQQQQQQQQRPPSPQPPQPPTVQPPQQPPASSPPQPEQRNDLLQPQPKAPGVKSKSIFTPIDDNKSMLAMQWGFGSDKGDTPIKQERPQFPDTSGARRPGPPPPPIPPHSGPAPQRSQSTASLSGEKRPNLKLQIPADPEGDAEGNTASPSAVQSSPKPGGDRAASKPPDGTLSAVERAGGGGGSGVVLPPPSPSASALLSAGAQGPPNPFARPLPPGAAGAGSQNAAAFGANANIETPISALPSRFVDQQFLPSPSSFYPEWGFGGAGNSAGGAGRSAGADGNMLPSPLNWQTPVGGTAPGFGRSSEDRKSEEPGAIKRERDGGGGADEGDAKRVKA